MKVAIIGFGWVGKAMYELFPHAFVYDNKMIIDWKQTFIDLPSRDVEGYREELNEADVAFICVPTPCPAEGALDTSIVEECVRWCKAELLVIRSTVNPGDCDRWAEKYGKAIVFQPEYLGETPAHPLLDTTKTPWMILGGDKKNTRKLIELYTTVYNANVRIRQMTLREAEVAKMSENRSIGIRRAEYQELYDACEADGNVDFYEIREAVYGDDPRFTLWWSFTFPGKPGFNSKCIPKDIYGWCAWAESCGYEPKITRNILERNELWINK